MDQIDEDKIGLFEGFDRLGISLEDLWLDAYALGGDLSLLETEAYVSGYSRMRTSTTYWPKRSMNVIWIKTSITWSDI